MQCYNITDNKFLEKARKKLVLRTVDFSEQFDLTDQKISSSRIREKASEIITLKDNNLIQTFDQFKTDAEAN